MAGGGVGWGRAPLHSPGPSDPQCRRGPLGHLCGPVRAAAAAGGGGYSGLFHTVCSLRLDWPLMIQTPVRARRVGCGPWEGVGQMAGPQGPQGPGKNPGGGARTLTLLSGLLFPFVPGVGGRRAPASSDAEGPHGKAPQSPSPAPGRLAGQGLEVSLLGHSPLADRLPSHPPEPVHLPARLPPEQGPGRGPPAPLSTCSTGNLARCGAGSPSLPPTGCQLRPRRAEETKSGSWAASGTPDAARAPRPAQAAAHPRAELSPQA